MKLFGFGLSPNSVIQRVHSSTAKTRLPTLKQSLCYGGVGFCLASIAVFAIVGCGQPWMYRYLGVLGPYLVATVLFIILVGGILSRLVIGPGGLLHFYPLFSVAFFSYAASWVIAYLKLRNLLGELLGSVTGSCLMALILVGAFRANKSLPRLIPVMVLANAVGYFLGRLLHIAMSGTGGMILFGASYGLGFGTGLGYALFLVQEGVRQRLGPVPTQTPRGDLWGPDTNS
jgi:hypothetical protein